MCLRKEVTHDSTDMWQVYTFSPFFLNVVTKWWWWGVANETRKEQTTQAWNRLPFPFQFRSLVFTWTRQPTAAVSVLSRSSGICSRFGGKSVHGSNKVFRCSSSLVVATSRVYTRPNGQINVWKTSPKERRPYWLELTCMVEQLSFYFFFFPSSWWAQTKVGPDSRSLIFKNL